jgi:hypothetical protein
MTLQQDPRFGETSFKAAQEQELGSWSLEVAEGNMKVGRLAREATSPSDLRARAREGPCFQLDMGSSERS